MKRILALVLCVLMLGSLGTAFASAEEDTVVITIDSVNGTRWADTMVVYKGRPTTQQNEWGWNVLVSAEGVATEKIAGGDGRGKNLAIPEGGFVVSGTGEVGQTMFDSIEIGDHVVFDEYGMRVLASKGEVDPFYEAEFTFTTYNAVRYANTIVIYNKGGSKTGTNGYGFEAVVNADGYVVSAGGNDNLIPQGGFVISAIEPADKAMVKAYCIPGAHCTIDGKKVRVSYQEEMLGVTVQNELALLEDEISAARDQLRLVDYEAVQASIDAFDTSVIKTLAERDAALKEVKRIGAMLIESRDVEVRGVWYVPLERTAEDIDATVAEMKRLGINQLNLGIIDSGKSIVRVSKEHPFKCDARVNRLDIVGEYVEACKANGIEIVLSVPIFHGQGHNKDWLTLTNKGDYGEELFCAPSSDEYCGYMMEFLEHLVRHYDIDGLQYDYIRYPYSDGATLDYGYDEKSIELFLEKTGYDSSVMDGIKTQLSKHPNWNEWVEFKMSLIDVRVAEFSAMIRECRPDLYISAAIADDTKPQSYCQDSTHWIKAGTVDGIYPMSYAAGIMGSSTNKFSAFLDDKTYLVMGNGAYQSLTMDEMYLQTNQTAVYGADGIAFFEWGAYVSHGYGEEFAETVFAKPALSFTFAESESIEALKNMAKARLQLWYDQHPNIDSAFPDELFDKDLQAIYDGLKAIADNEYLLQDIDLALRIEKFSKEDKKGGDYLLPLEKEDETSADSSEEVSEETTSTEESVNETKPGKSVLPWILIGVAVVAVIAVVVIVLIKKK